MSESLCGADCFVGGSARLLYDMLPFSSGNHWMIDGSRGKESGNRVRVVVVVVASVVVVVVAVVVAA